MIPILIRNNFSKMVWKCDLVEASVTRLGDLLFFGQLFKAFGEINLAKSPTFLGNFCKGVNLVLGNFYRLWNFFSGHIG